MITFHVPVTIGVKTEGSPLHKNVPLVILPWYVCAGIPPLATAGVLAKINTAAKQARSTAVAKRRCDRSRFRVNQQYVFIQTSKGTGNQSSGISLRFVTGAQLTVRWTVVFVFTETSQTTK